MVRCNLSVLLAERNLKITRVCKDTGLSRTTLTYLANNYSKGIQYDTLNKLCAYLQVLPGELISFVPVDISCLNVLRTGDKNEQLEIELEITHRGVTKKCQLCGNAYLYFSDAEISDSLGERRIHIPYEVEIDVDLFDSDGDPECEKENEFIVDAFQSLPITFLKDIENDITGDIVNDIDQEFGLSDYSNQIEPIFVSFSWDFHVSKSSLSSFK